MTVREKMCGGLCEFTGIEPTAIGFLRAIWCATGIGGRIACPAACMIIPRENERAEETAETEQAVSPVCSECVGQERSFIIRNSSEFPIIQKVLTGGMRMLRRGKGCLRQPRGGAKKQANPS